ncbi:1A family penicillin-binding protein [Bacillus cereus VD133]|uniref:1A family penicillin-binding protein n=1 Tax=Bacillus cereus VD133 TaxID=1053233 RepID=A0A9W5PL90_BACCE|nr:1A family penicillin-binding protein [Bacillus cereus VD133]
MKNWLFHKLIGDLLYCYKKKRGIIVSENYPSRRERRESLVSKSNKKQKKQIVRFKKILIGCLLIGFVTIIFSMCALFEIIKDSPKLEEEKLVNPLSTKFYDKDNKLIYEYGKEKRTNVTYSQIPKVLEHALLATEDIRFYEHNGIDFRGTIRAIYTDLISRAKAQGGSTITQQVIKNYFLNSDKSMKRKVKEWYLAHKLEQSYTKQEILVMYLNKINFGNHSYGIATAAKNYYGKDVKDLSLPQAAMLAGLPNGPYLYDPTNEKHRDVAKKRRDNILAQMNKYKYITKKQMEEAQKVPITEGLKEHQNQTEMPYQGFFDAVVKEVTTEMKGVKIDSDGLSIYTTLDPKAQEYADTIMNGDIVKYPSDKFQGAFTFMDTKTGEVRAIGSGRGEMKAIFKGYNLAVSLKRQVGSTFKPIFDFGPAIEYLNWSTNHPLLDSEYKYSTGQEVRNADRTFRGSITMREALRTSHNIPAIKAAKEVGLNKAAEFAKNLGISFEHDNVVESTAIGSNESSPLIIAGAYAAFGNNGIYNKPHFVRKVISQDGKTTNFDSKGKRVMKNCTAFMITDMLRTVVNSGTGTTAKIDGLDVAGKTGTQNYDSNTMKKYNLPEAANRDSWFAGYTPQYTMAIWTGYPTDGAEYYVDSQSTKIAPQIFKEMMSKFGTDKSHFYQPPSVMREGEELIVKEKPKK